MFKIIVLVKQVPDTHNIVGEAMKEDGTVNRAVLPAIFNPEDLNALEMALEVKDMYGGTISIITMGPPGAVEILRESLYRGADNAYLISDRRFAGADTLATSYSLSMAINKIKDYDLIFCGRQAIDGDTAQVGPQVAEKLNIPQVTYAEEILDLKKDSVTIRKQIDGGYEILQAKLPILISVVDSANEPRPWSAKLVMSKKKAISTIDAEYKAEHELYIDIEDYKEQLRQKGLLVPVWNIEDIGANEVQCGLKGSPTNVYKIENVVLTATEHKNIEANQDGVDKLVEELVNDHIIG